MGTSSEDKSKRLEQLYQEFRKETESFVTISFEVKKGMLPISKAEIIFKNLESFEAYVHQAHQMLDANLNIVRLKLQDIHSGTGQNVPVSEPVTEEKLIKK